MKSLGNAIDPSVMLSIEFLLAIQRSWHHFWRHGDPTEASGEMYNIMINAVSEQSREKARKPRSNHHRHPAPSANVFPVVQSPSGKTRGMGCKEVRESLTYVCLIGEGFTPKMIVQRMEEVVI
ncbi:hypothetical protein TNCV_42801 [Trichonephila clavipes]|nr:hypothetical protein TNCV_42801 [Trichonephila clavipes]